MEEFAVEDVFIVGFEGVGDVRVFGGGLRGVFVGIGNGTQSGRHVDVNRLAGTDGATGGIDVGFAYGGQGAAYLYYEGMEGNDGGLGEGGGCDLVDDGRATEGRAGGVDDGFCHGGVFFLVM